MLSAGTRFGPYEIVSAIGAGGMGEVYKARDTRLDRTVAIKVLPAMLALDSQFRERFEREAKSISSLNHPNICTLHDVGHHEGTEYLVMEFLDGESLAARLTRGALPLSEALRIGVEIAGALDKAHRQGIVHRDLKPGNVMLTKTGSKLLDFGLAKIGPSAVLSGAAQTALVTSIKPADASPPLTVQGTILGTFQYMAPEQVEGDEVGARSDIFAFGSLLYEMFTGRKAFSGKSQASLLGAILKDDPPPVSQLQPLAPPALDYLVRTCLAKDPDARFQTAHDLLLQLKWIAEGGSAAGVPAPVVAHRRNRERTAWIIAAALGVLCLGASAISVMHLGEAPPLVEPVQFQITSPEGSLFGGAVPQFAVSPDGRQLVYSATQQSASVLWIRPIGALVARPLPGTELASFPFWSADSRFIGFFAAGKLKKVQASGGPPVPLCDAPNGRGGTWNKDNVIVFAPSPSGPLHRISSAGGVSSVLTELAQGETTHRWPVFLPDGDAFLFYGGTPPAATELRAGSLRAGSASAAIGIAAESGVTYSAGHVLFSRGGSLMAQAFDPETRQATGDPFPITDQVGTDSVGFSSFSASAGGLLAYARGSARPRARLTWFDRAGKAIDQVGDAGEYYNLSLSPDERRVGVSLQTGSPPNRDVWLLDLARGGAPSRFTFDPASEGLPIWSPGGDQIAFGSTRAGAWSPYTKMASGGGQEVLAFPSTITSYPMDWSLDGEFLAISQQAGQTGQDLAVLPLSGEKKLELFLQTPFNEDNPAFSPDGKWIAYDSNESGRIEVYVRPFPSAAGQYMVSRNGGSQPLWRRDGKELFFVSPDGALMAASITTAKDFERGVPQTLFPAGVVFTGNRRQYAVTKDGKRFLAIVPEQRTSPSPITVVINWIAALQK
jgi:serine/threonine protein kinase